MGTRTESEGQECLIVSACVFAPCLQRQADVRDHAGPAGVRQGILTHQPRELGYNLQTADHRWLSMHKAAHDALLAKNQVTKQHTQYNPM